MKANLIGGRWLDGTQALDNVNPSDIGDIIDTYALADTAQVACAMEAAAAAFGEWSLSTPQQRFDVLDGIGAEILARKAELGDLLAREEGKTLPEAIGEVARAGQIFKFFAGEALRTGGETLPSVRPDIRVEVTREPIGVVGIITPWNFPIAIPAWKIAPALAYGNCVVFKPAEAVPGSAWALTEIIARSALPAGAFNLVMGQGAEVGPAMLNDANLSGLTFTGSVATGRRIAAAALTRDAGMPKLQLEMGGKNAFVVLNDADIDNAVHCAIQSAFYSTGQRCTAASRLIVADGIHDKFVRALVEKMAALNVGDARDPATHIGPVVDERQLEQDLRYVALGKEEGATLVSGGELLRTSTQGKRGHYFRPALFTETHNAMRINQEEIFGPVATVQRVKGYEEALAIVNDSSLGLVAGICTTSLRHATHFKRHAQTGMVMVNVPTAGVDYHVPFGGRKGSSYGPREQGRYAVDFYTTVKTSYIGA
ncbi:aldehyde dehydrogenase family protein [Cupriavidus sp. AcVe19-1a]|uniref:aldehyde dehydrogenase family protein n=1 Tax=Cupriavidus sp. AcVe19-1a TaxID=2821359 RepID=UPI001AE864DA|nr:aldehyde dehydrogenase family protein [Cupriavidus sp. AcVe19-1a]MBP0633084.1 aldehyde dehydrogenase family protein [Cupriavidus sp. AcVe19-1a]